MVSSEAAGKWPVPELSYHDGQMTISHDFFDQVKIYYSVNGSEPTLECPVYNPSTTYFQPDTIKPLAVGNGVTVKACAVGFGRHDSDVAVCEAGE